MPYASAHLLVRLCLSGLLLLWAGLAAWLVLLHPGVDSTAVWGVFVSGLSLGGLAFLLDRALGRSREAAQAETEGRLRLFRKAVESSSDGMAIRDAEFRPVYANAAYTRILGLTQEDFLHGDLLQFCRPETAVFLRDTVFAELRRRGAWQGEISFQGTKGREVVLWASIDSVRDRRGRITHYIGVFHDMTGPRQDSEALQRSESRLRMVLDATSDGVFDHNLETGETYFSDSYYRLLGFPRGRDDDARFFWGSRIHPGDKGLVLEALRAHCEGRTPTYRAEFRIRDSQDRWRWVLSRGSVVARDAAGRPLRLVGTHADITESKRAQAALESAQEELEQRVRERTRELLEAGEQVRDLTRELLEVQESERRRIARDLHDNVAQNLSSLKIMLGALLAEVPGLGEALRDKAALAVRILQDAIGSVRGIAYDLRPPSLDQLGLVRAVEQHCEDFARLTGIPVDFSPVGMENIQLDGNVEVNLFRIIQEALTNVGKHSRASGARVRLVASYPHILLRVEDDGLGFDPAAGLAAAGDGRRMGLRSMTERARILGGDLRIVSSPGKGARLVVEVPYAGRSDGEAQADSHR